MLLKSIAGLRYPPTIVRRRRVGNESTRNQRRAKSPRRKARCLAKRFREMAGTGITNAGADLSDGEICFSQQQLRRCPAQTCQVGVRSGAGEFLEQPRK